MQITIVAVGTRMPEWVKKGFEEYTRRMPPEMKMNLKEVRPAERSSTTSAEAAMSSEYTRIQTALPKNVTVIALDERGRQMTTVQLSKSLQKWQMSGKDIAFVIGGADGLDKTLKDQADSLLSLSNLTLPHGMARILLAEQLYRAWTITQNHPYHRS